MYKNPNQVIKNDYMILPVCANDTETFNILNSADTDEKNFPNASGSTKISRCLLSMLSG